MQKYAQLLLLICFTLGCSRLASAQQKILIITSNQHTYPGTTINNANHFSEIVQAYDVFVKSGYIVDFVSPNGGSIPVGYIATSDSLQKNYLYNNAFMNLLKNTKKPEHLTPNDYRAVYYSGGGSAMFGVPENTPIQHLVQAIYNSGGILSAVCHGTAGMVNLKDSNGQPLYKHKKISGYPDLFEDHKAPYYQTFPFSIEKMVRANGGHFLYSEKPNVGFYIQDKRFITGQDPSSSTIVAKKVIQAIIVTKSNN